MIIFARSKYALPRDGPVETVTKNTKNLIFYLLTLLINQCL